MLAGIASPMQSQAPSHFPFSLLFPDRHPVWCVVCLLAPQPHVQSGFLLTCHYSFHARYPAGKPLHLATWQARQWQQCLQRTQDLNQSSEHGMCFYTLWCANVFRNSSLLPPLVVPKARGPVAARCPSPPTLRSLPVAGNALLTWTVRAIT